MIKVEKKDYAKYKALVLTSLERLVTDILLKSIGAVILVHTGQVYGSLSGVGVLSYLFLGVFFFELPNLLKQYQSSPKSDKNRKKRKV